jgi:hypothetical protein
MTGIGLWLFVGIFVVFNFIANVLLTREIFEHVFEKKLRILFLILIWCIPIIGAFYFFRKLGMDYYKTSETSHTGVNVGLLGMDEIFNPSVKPKYVIEEIIKENSEGKRE